MRTPLVRSALLALCALTMGTLGCATHDDGAADLGSIGIAPEAECAAGQKHFFWSDDSALDMHSIRRGSIPCGAFF